MSQAICEHLDWDSHFFGLRIARVNDAALNSNRLIEALEWGKAGHVDCLYLLVESDDALSTRMVQANGFVLTDVRMTFERACRGHEASAVGGDSNIIRPAQPGDLPALKAIARVSHTDTRFYSDLNFPRDRCDALYETWIENSCNGFAQAVFVAERDQEVCGYVTCHLRNIGSACEAQLGLIAVAEHQRGKGLGKALVNTFIGWAVQHGASHLTVITQARNIPAQRLYQQQGFLTRSVQLWFHYWRCRN